MTTVAVFLVIGGIVVGSLALLADATHLADRLDLTNVTLELEDTTTPTES